MNGWYVRLKQASNHVATLVQNDLRVHILD